MNNKGLVLLKTMFASTSYINALKHADKQKKKKTRASLIGVCVLAVYLTVMVGLLAYSMASYGYGDTVPLTVATVITLMSLVFTLLKSNGYLYGFKEYDMLMAMPFPVSTIVTDKFLYMYLRDLRWDVLVSFSALIGYAAALKPGPLTYVAWILLTPFITFAPMVLASLIGVLVAGVGARSKHKNLVQIILIYIFIIPLFFIQYIINYLISNDKVGDTFSQTAQMAAAVGKVIPTVGWFGKAVTGGSVLSFILMIAVSLALFAALIAIISRSYRRINTGLAGRAVHRKAKKASGQYKKRSVITSIAYKEYKRLSGSIAAATNILLGCIMALLFGLILLFVKADTIVQLFTHGVEVDVSPYKLMWPMIVYFFVGMLPTTAPSPSLEGKNYWIIKSLPVDPMTIYKGKMLFNLCVFVPSGVFATVSGMHSLGAEPVEYLLAIILIVVQCLFSTAYGMRCGIKHVKLEWENEMEVVKQGSAVTLYLLPNMFATMLLIGGMIPLSFVIDINTVILIVTAVYLILAVLSYLSVVRLAKKESTGS